MENEIKAEFFMERDENGIASFGCKVGERTVKFFPEIEISEDGVYTGYLGISYEIIYYSPEEIHAVKKVFQSKMEIVSNYFDVFVGSEWGPIPKSIYDNVLTLELTDEEITLVQSKLSQFTYIYLIKDNRTGYTKIGRSDSPTDRLKTLTKQDTLMPEPNEFTLLFAWADYAYKEKLLHKQFESVRVRGEWFNLDAGDINEIWNQYFSEKDLITGKSKNEIYEESYRQYKAEQIIKESDDNSIN